MIGLIRSEADPALRLEGGEGGGSWFTSVDEQFLYKVCPQLQIVSFVTHYRSYFYS